jgi:DNA-binding NarL/FixJ family response regulator
LLALERMSGFMHGVEAGWRTPASEPTGEGPGAQMLAATLALERLVDGADRERAVAMARFALDGDQLLTVDDGQFWVPAAVVRILADDDVGDFWSRAHAAGRARGSLFAALSASLWEGFWQWRRGELHEALACLRVALDQDRMWGTSIGEPYIRAFEVGCHLDRGDLPAARRAADAVPPGTAVGDGGRLLRQAIARLLVAEGRHQEAFTAIEAVPVPIAIRNPVWNPWRSIAAAALHGLGRSDDAVPLAEEEVALLRRWAAPSALGAALCLLGQMRGDAGLEQLREAVAVLASTPAAVELARARCALGSSPRVTDQEAVPLLRAASAQARARGASGVWERARDALVRRGQQVEPHADRVRTLSRTERQILELAGAGLDIREVAQRLFVTPGTVREVLDAAGRDEAAGPGSSRSQEDGGTMPVGQDGRVS